MLVNDAEPELAGVVAAVRGGSGYIKLCKKLTKDRT